MDTFARLIIVVVLAAFYAPSHSATYTPDFGELKSIDGDLHITRGNGTTSLMYPDAGLSKSIDVSTSKGNFPVPVQKSFPVVPTKVAKAATRFLKTLPLIGTAITFYDTVCDLSDLCLVDGQLSVITPGIFPNGYATCEDAAGFSSSPQYVCNLVRNSNPGKTIYWMRSPDSLSSCTLAGTAGFSYVARGYMDCVDPPVDNNRAPTESDWASAETKLAAQPQQVAEALYNSDAPVPVNASTQSAPVTQQIAQTSTQTKDSQGNVTGTQVATTSVKVEDTSTAGNVTYNVTETTTITNYNENNEITSSQTSTSDNQPPEPPKPPEPEDVTMNHGGVPEIPLLTQVIDAQEELDNNQQTPWSAGTCPADIDVGIYGLEFSFAPFCTFAEGLRPVVLTLGAFLSFYILAGFKFD
ncbi:hypothetical protein SAMN05216339_1225 [Nitrosomonas eutropha]|uniref:TspB protein n=1 Tax=Nitrosomonas eutropha TaxID=916 RepID=A0A1I7JDM9_9PROT|nr:virulence factor TspB C-terminal domain-related protein [Nitrosomonas eutropha]SFU83258.1 hypothetical protein SAMN05216339_1225 [Nitrosomonas eutropha]